MCGRFTLRSPGRIRFDAKRETPPPLFAPRFNIAPSQDVLTVMSDESERVLVPARWGLSLVPADGFYEWKRSGKSKQPYYFQLKDEALFYFAGIWDRWRRGEESITSCAIITTTPNEILETIHDRMPVILPGEAEDAWLVRRAIKGLFKKTEKFFNRKKLSHLLIRHLRPTPRRSRIRTLILRGRISWLARKHSSSTWLFLTEGGLEVFRLLTTA